MAVSTVFSRKQEASKARILAQTAAEADKRRIADEDAFDLGDAVDLGVMAAATAAAIPTGGMSWTAVLPILTTAVGAHTASKNIREGITEGDTKKVGAGAIQAATTYAGAKAARSKGAQELLAKYQAGGGAEGGMDVLTDEEMKLFLKLDAQGAFKSGAAPTKVWEADA